MMPREMIGEFVRVLAGRVLGGKLSRAEVRSYSDLEGVIACPDRTAALIVMKAVEDGDPLEPDRLMILGDALFEFGDQKLHKAAVAVAAAERRLRRTASEIENQAF